MNVALPHFGLADESFFWVLVVSMLAVSAGMLGLFRRRGWL
jgi:Mg2+ and Co2+ transporter CorA